MGFVVSARKYRPHRFEDVVGQEHVSQTLKKALQTDHVAHAFLFCGPRGVGKTTCARILAKVLNCQNVSSDFEPCGQCESCRAFNENASFNIMELDAASNNSVEHIRTLAEQVRFQPQQGKYKVYIIDEVHMLTQSAFNAFLKTLEEPPPYAIFILATTEKHKIIPTILSRCQIFDFKRIQVADIVAHLQDICSQEGIEADGDALHIIAQKADGALRDALSIFDRIISFSGKKITYEDVITNLNVLDYDYYFRFADALLTEDLPQVMLIFNTVLRNGFEGDLFVNGLAEHLRNLLVCKDPDTLRLLEVSEALRERYRQQAAITPSSFILTALNLCNQCDIHYKTARNKPLHVEMTLIKMCYIGQAVQLAAGVHNGAAPASAPTVSPEKKTADLNKTAVYAEKTYAQSVSEPDLSEKKITESTAAILYQPAASAKEEEAEIEPPPTSPSLSGLRKAGLGSLPKLQSLDSITAEIKNLESNGKPVTDSIPLTLETARNAWMDYVESNSKDSVKGLLKGADIQVHSGQINATVGSVLAESAIRHESGLMEFLREKLLLPKLALVVKLDPSRSNAAPARPQRLTDSQKYHAMKLVNPLVDEMRKRLDLGFEGRE